MLEIPELASDPSLTTQEATYLRLRNAIMVGAIQPETTLTIRGLADYLGLSPTPIREALRRLGSERAIEMLGNRRISIPVMTIPRLDEIVRLRTVLEQHAALRALPFVSDVLIDRMRALDARMDDDMASGDMDALTIANHDFHRTLYTANPDQAAMPAIESVWLQLGPFQRQAIRAVRDFYLVDRHKEVLAALRLRDPDALSVAIEADIRDGILRAGMEALRRRSQADAGAGQPAAK